MKVYAQFYGGYSYAVPYPDDYEEFESIGAAKEAFRQRMDFDPKYPCTDNTARMLLFFDKPEIQEYPDRIIKIGRCGGIINEQY